MIYLVFARKAGEQAEPKMAFRKKETAKKYEKYLLSPEMRVHRYIATFIEKIPFSER